MSELPIAITTVASKAHLPRVRVLAGSLRRHHPELTLTMLLVDEPEGCFEPGAEPFEILHLEEVTHRDLHAQIRAHRPSIGACAMSIKPALLEHVLDRGHPAAIHLDSDVLVTGRLDPVIAALGSASAVITRHVSGWVHGPAAALWRWAIRVGGLANAGVVGASGDAQGRDFLRWWGDRAAQRCGLELEAGVFFDQRWLDLAPGFFDRVVLLDDPGVNVGCWNLPERPLQWRDGILHAGDAPCRAVHLAGFDPARPQIVSTYMPELTLDVAGVMGDLVREYHEALLAAGWKECSTWPWAFAQPEHAGA